MNISFEFFPPKSNKGLEQLKQTAEDLAVCHPSFFSITYGAGGSAQNGTLQTLQLIQPLAPVAAHITTDSLSWKIAQSLLHKYQEQGINRLVVLRGDATSSEQAKLVHASELVAYIRKEFEDTFHIAVAAYPEAHPEAINLSSDIHHLKSKFDLGANTAITQFFFNPEAFYYFRDRCAAAGINTTDIIPGIIPILNPENLKRFANKCGADIPRWIIKGLDDYAQDSVSLRSFCQDVITNLCDNLVKYDVNHIHFYTLNQSKDLIKIYKNLI